MLRAVPYHRAARRVTLPMDILMRVSARVCVEGPGETASCSPDCAGVVAGRTSEEGNSDMLLCHLDLTL